MSATALLGSIASEAASAVDFGPPGSVFEAQNPVNISAIFASICTVLLAIALIEGSFNIKKKIKQNREFELAQVQNAEWRARIERAIPMATLLQRGRSGPAFSSRDLLSDDFSEVSLDEDEREYAARSMEER
ncbi:hypothetical protein BDY24DRAFT_418686 [Mrakia frigida]|uniref:uncharacterized protein n=1 Tax=Mrakia frigida TaxID=29902 RepID=UPI003FCC2345